MSAPCAPSTSNRWSGSPLAHFQITLGTHWGIILPWHLDHNAIGCVQEQQQKALRLYLQRTWFVLCPPCHNCRKDGFCGLQEMTADKLNFLKDFWDCGRHTDAIFCYQSWFYGFIVPILTLLFNFLQLSIDLNTQIISETILSQWTL